MLSLREHGDADLKGMATSIIPREARRAKHMERGTVLRQPILRGSAN